MCLQFYCLEMWVIQDVDEETFSKMFTEVFIIAKEKNRFEKFK